MNRWVIVGSILAFLMLPTIAFSAKSNYLDNVESNERPISLLHSSQEISAEINATSPTFVTSNSSTPTAASPESKTIPVAQIIALSASVIVAAVCIWICFRKPSSTRTRYYQPKAIRLNAYFSKTKLPSTAKSATPTQEYTTNSPQAPKTRICHSSHQPLKPLVLEQMWH